MDDPVTSALDPTLDDSSPTQGFVAGPVGITEHDIESAPLETNGLPPAAAVDAALGMGLESFARRQLFGSNEPIPAIPVETPVMAPKAETPTVKKSLPPPPPIVAPLPKAPEPPTNLPVAVSGPPIEQDPVPVVAPQATLAPLAGTETPAFSTSPSKEELEHKARALVQNSSPSAAAIARNVRKKKAITTAILGSLVLVITGAGLWIGAYKLGIPGITDVRRAASELHGQPCTNSGEKICDATGKTSLECTQPGESCNTQATGSVWCETQCGNGSVCEEGAGCRPETACTLGTKACQGNSVTTCVAPGTQGNSNPYNTYVISQTCIGGIESCVNGSCQVSATGAQCSTGAGVVEHGERACYSYTDCRVCNNGEFTNNIGAGSPGCPWPCDRAYESGEIKACQSEMGCTENLDCQEFDGNGKTYVCGYDSAKSCKTCVDQTAIPACTNDLQCPGGYRCVGGECKTHTFCEDGCCDVGTEFPGCYVIHYATGDRGDATVTDTIINSGVQRACVGAQACGAERIDVVCPPNGQADSWSVRYAASCTEPQPTPNLPRLSCNAACSPGGQACPSGQACLGGFCRNPQCASETDCSCNTTQEQLTCDTLTSVEAPTLGSEVSFRCSADRVGANHFEFRYRIDGGAFFSIPEAAVGSGQSRELQILKPGRYEVQCRACKSTDSSDCTVYQPATQ